MATLTQANGAGEFIISEANGQLSRENMTVASGQNLAAGAVIAKLTADGKYVEYDDVGTDGSEVAAGILYAAVDASAADKPGVALVRAAEVDGNLLAWFTGATQGNKDNGTADLAGSLLIVR